MAHTLKGMSQRQLGFPQLARNDVDEALRLRPEPDIMADLLHERGMANILLGNFNDAIDDFRGEISLEPMSPSAHNNIGISLVRLKRAGESVPYFERAAQINPKIMKYHHNKGAALLVLREYSRALDSLMHAIHIRPSVESLAYAAEAFANLGNHEKAREYSRATLDLFGKIPLDKRSKRDYLLAIGAERSLTGALKTTYAPKYEQESVERGILSRERIRNSFRPR